MIQPIKAGKNEWRISWVDTENPLPCRREITDAVSEEGGFFLPTVVIVSTANGKLIDRPRLLEELDQIQVESFLESLFDQHGQPECLAIESSPNWEEKAWQRFSRDYKLDIHFTDHPRKSPESRRELARNLTDALMRDRKEMDALAPGKIAEGLIATAQRMRTPDKRMALFHKALEIDSHCTRARVELADGELQAGNWSNALRGYEEVIAHESRRRGKGDTCPWAEMENRPVLRARFGRVMVLWQYGKYVEAAGECEHLLELNSVDNQGVRFLLPMLYLLAHDSEKASAFFRHYIDAFPKDYQEPAFLFGWGLALSFQDEESGAKVRYKEGILKNFYVPRLLLEQPLPPSELWLPNDRADLTYAQEFMDSYAVLWDRDTGALRLLREAYEEILPRVGKLLAHRQQMLEFQDQRYDPAYREKWQKLLAEDEAMVKL